MFGTRRGLAAAVRCSASLCLTARMGTIATSSLCVAVVIEGTTPLLVHQLNTTVAVRCCSAVRDECAMTCAMTVVHASGICQLRSAHWVVQPVHIRAADGALTGASVAKTVWQARTIRASGYPALGVAGNIVSSHRPDHRGMPLQPICSAGPRVRARTQRCVLQGRSKL